MADPHNKKRYGELWDNSIINSYLWEFEPGSSRFESLRPYVIFSGGWAWHFMSPYRHKELKHAHDHKDADIFVPPENVAKVIELLTNQGFKKTPTRFDKLTNNSDFRRYEKLTRDDHRLTIDFFVRNDINVRKIDSFDVLGRPCAWNVVEPQQLLSFYKSIHSSDNCFAVKAAANLLNLGIDPVGRKELIEIPED